MVPVPFLRRFPGLFALRGTLIPSRRGKPQCGQEYALSDTFPEHSGHIVSAMLSISFLGWAAGSGDDRFVRFSDEAIRCLCDVQVDYECTLHILILQLLQKASYHP